jgi:hypothetical protein
MEEDSQQEGCLEVTKVCALHPSSLHEEWEAVSSM